MGEPQDKMSREEMSRWMAERATRDAEPPPETLLDLPTPADLERYLAAQLPEASDVRVQGLERIAYGAAREHYGFEARWRERGVEVRESFVLLRDHEVPEELGAQLDPLPTPDPTVFWVLGHGDREREFQILRFLEGTRVPAPRARWLDASGSWLQRPFTIHQRVAGRVAPSFTLLGVDTASQRDAIARQFVGILATIHGVDWCAGGLASLGVPVTGTRDYADRVIDALDRRLALSCPERPPLLERALEWLRAHRPTLECVALCHGDYKMDNLIFEGDRIHAIIDWEFAHLGDPLEDLGGACLGLHETSGLCMGLLPRDELLAAYAAAADRAVDPDRVLYWEIVQTVRMTSFAQTLLESSSRYQETAPDSVDPDEMESLRAFFHGMIHRMLEDLRDRVG